MNTKTLLFICITIGATILESAPQQKLPKNIDYLAYLPLDSIVRHECSKNPLNPHCETVSDFLQTVEKYNSLKEKDESINELIRDFYSASFPKNNLSQINTHLRMKRVLKIKLKDHTSQVDDAVVSLVSSALISKNSTEEKIIKEFNLINKTAQNIGKSEPKDEADNAN